MTASLPYIVFSSHSSLFTPGVCTAQSYTLDPIFVSEANKNYRGNFN